MSFPRYERYKDSGVEWLGEVPGHWQLSKLASVAAFKGGGTPAKDKLEFWNGEIPWVSPKDMKNEFIETSEDAITEAGLAASATTLIPSGAVLMVVRSGILKHTIPVAINTVPVTLNQDMKAIVINPSVALSEFFLRWVQGLNELLLNVWLKQGATVESVEHFYISNTDVPFPPISEQAVICQFLRAETAKIDALIEEQRRLIELLKEKRQAVISHAVMKGVDSTASTKESGVDWIGPIPLNWAIVKFTREVKISEGQVDPKIEPYASMLLIGPEHVESRTGRLLARESAHEQAAESGKYYCLSGDVIYSKIRPALGKVVLAPEDCICSADMYPFSSRGALHHQYMQWLLLSNEFITWSMLESDRVAMPKLNRETLSKLKVPVPPRQDQKAISDYLKAILEQYDKLYFEANAAIDLLKERRSALISAAVTGKIDVRNYTPKEAA